MRALRREQQAAEAGSSLRGLRVLRARVAPPRDSSSGRAVGARRAEPRRSHAAEGGGPVFQAQACSVIGVRWEVCMGLMGPDRGLLEGSWELLLATG